MTCTIGKFDIATDDIGYNNVNNVGIIAYIWVIVIFFNILHAYKTKRNLELIKQGIVLLCVLKFPICVISDIINYTLLCI